jgi:hypothetical protein
VHHPAEFLFKIIMKYKHSILGLAAGTALLLSAGCSKQESPATTAGETADKSQAPAASEKQEMAQAPKAADIQPAAATKPADATMAAPAPVAAQPQQATAEQALVKTGVVSGRVTAQTLAATLRAQRDSAAQAGVNQVETLAAAGTNQALAGLALTNQLASASTNQVQALLEQAKSLTKNQKYQEALTSLTQLYSTKLTPAQKQQADDLKAQIQTAMTQKASSALGNILGGKKE